MFSLEIHPYPGFAFRLQNQLMHESIAQHQREVQNFSKSRIDRPKFYDISIDGDLRDLSDDHLYCFLLALAG